MLHEHELSQNVEVPTHRNGGILDIFISGHSCTSLHVSKDCAVSKTSDHNPVRVDLNLNFKLKSNEHKITVHTQNFDNDEIISIRDTITL